MTGLPRITIARICQIQLWVDRRGTVIGLKIYIGCRKKNLNWRCFKREISLDISPTPTDVIADGIYV